MCTRLCRSARLYQCARCHCQVVICSHCDRGNIYCSGECSSLSRSEKQREASARHQSSTSGSGRRLHALRQQRYRQRQREKVTDQGSELLAPYDVLLSKPESIVTRSEKPPLNTHRVVHCHFCGCQCSERLRLSFLYRQRRHSVLVYPF